MTDDKIQKPATVGDIAKQWWDGLRPERKQDGRRSGNPGALARLRRADLASAAIEEVTIDLFTALASRSTLSRGTLFERTALVAAVLAHVRANDTRKVAAAAGTKIGDDRRVLNPLRLRRLFAARTPAECLLAFRRLVAILDRQANVDDLAESLLDWPDAKYGERRRTRWAFDYYGASIAKPDDNDQAAA
jgi:CRISPR type I-E-associated protein CasB/Cse2